MYRHVWQAYGTYVFPVGRGLQTDFGKFASMLGYETNYAKDNHNFSRAYLFNFLPFYHSGLRVTLPVNDKVTVIYMLTNGIQQTEDFNDFKSNHFAAIVKPIAQRDLDGELLLRPGAAGRRRAGRARTASSACSTPTSRYTATSALTLGARRQLRAPTRSTRGRSALVAAGRRRLRALSGRRRRPRSPCATSAWTTRGCSAASTRCSRRSPLTAEYKFADGFLVRGEFRRDWSNEPFFTGPGGAGDLRDHQNTALVGLVWVVRQQDRERGSGHAGSHLHRLVRSVLRRRRRLRGGLPAAPVRSVMTLESIAGLVISVLPARVPRLRDAASGEVLT